MRFPVVFGLVLSVPAHIQNCSWLHWEKKVFHTRILWITVCSTERETCMMQLCNDCLREEGVLGFLESFDSVKSPPNEISYKQWVTVACCTMADKVEPLHEYLSPLSMKISRMVHHHFFFFFFFFFCSATITVFQTVERNTTTSE